MHTCTHAHMHTCTHAHMHTRAYIYTHKHMHICTIMCVGLHASKTGGPEVKVGNKHMLVYGNPSSGKVIHHKVPIIPESVLTSIVTTQCDRISLVRKLMSDPITPRVVINAAWSFPTQRRRFQLFPSFAAFDIVGGTNKQLRPLMQMTGLDNYGKNIPCAQGLLQDQTTQSLAFWFCTALPYLLGRHALQCVCSVCMDECGEEWAALNVAVLQSIFNTKLCVFPCAFHKLTLALQKPDNLGRGVVTPAMYDSILRSCMHICTQSVMHTCTHAHMHTCTHARAHMHTCTHAHIHTCTHAHMHTCTHAHMHTCTHAHMHTCTHAHMHTCTHAHQGIYIHT
jgi:hypothetical protein